jgi:glutaredoxin
VPIPVGDGGAGPASPPTTGGPPVVTIYGTSWCGACKAARQYFAGRKIPFADKDIERDPEAARELAAKGAKMGIPTDRVPVIDVRGRLLLGFDRQRIEMLLGEAT